MFDPTSTEKLSSSSGIPIHITRLPWVSGWVEVRLLVSIGARHDPIGLEGLAHFYEHSLFWGNQRYETDQKIWDYSDTNLFGSLNGETGFDYTSYSLKATVSKIGEAIDFLRQLIFFSIVSAENLEKEKRIITQEVWRKFKAKEAIDLEQMIRNHIYGDHPFSRIITPAGFPETIAKITLDGLSALKRFYAPQNMQFVFVGDITPGHAKLIVDGFARNIEGFDAVPSIEPITTWPDPKPNQLTLSHAEWFKTAKNMMQETEIVLSRPLPWMENTSLPIIALALIEDLLYKSLRGKLGATYSVRSHADFYRDFVNCRIRIPFANDQLATALELIEKYLALLANDTFPRGDITEAFDRIKTRRLSRLRAQDRTATSIADDITDMLRSLDRVITTEERISETEALQLEDVIAFARANFTNEKIYRLVMLP